MALTRVDIYNAAPDFDLTDRTGVSPVANAAQDALVDTKLAAAVIYVDRTVFKSSAEADQATIYYTLHLLALALPAVYARLQKTRGDDKLHTSDDVYFEIFRMLAQGAAGGALVV